MGTDKPHINSHAHADGHTDTDTETDTDTDTDTDTHLRRSDGRTVSIAEGRHREAIPGV